MCLLIYFYLKLIQSSRQDPATYLDRMDPAIYSDQKDPATYSDRMDPATYSGWMDPASYLGRNDIFGPDESGNIGPEGSGNIFGPDGFGNIYSDRMDPASYLDRTDSDQQHWRILYNCFRLYFFLEFKLTVWALLKKFLKQPKINFYFI